MNKTTNALRALELLDRMTAGGAKGVIETIRAALATAQPDTPREPAEDAVGKQETGAGDHTSEASE